MWSFTLDEATACWTYIWEWSKGCVCGCVCVCPGCSPRHSSSNVPGINRTSKLQIFTLLSRLSSYDGVGMVQECGRSFCVCVCKWTLDSFFSVFQRGSKIYCLWQFAPYEIQIIASTAVIRDDLWQFLRLFKHTKCIMNDLNPKHRKLRPKSKSCCCFWRHLLSNYKPNEHQWKSRFGV